MEKHLAPELGGDITGLNWTLKETKKENAKHRFNCPRISK